MKWPQLIIFFFLPSLLFCQEQKPDFKKHQFIPAVGLVLPVGNFSSIDANNDQSGRATAGISFSLKYRNEIKSGYGLSAAISVKNFMRRYAKQYKSIDGTPLDFELLKSDLNSDIYTYLLGFSKTFYLSDAKTKIIIEPNIGLCRLHTKEFEIYHQDYGFDFEWQQFKAHQSNFEFISGLNISANYDITNSISGGFNLSYLYSIVELNPQVIIYKDRDLVYNERMYRKQPVSFLGFSIELIFAF